MENAEQLNGDNSNKAHSTDNFKNPDIGVQHDEEGNICLLYTSRCV